MVNNALQPFGIVSNEQQVASLATTFLTGLTTQATRCRLLQPITRRRLAAITAVLGQLTTQIRILLRHARQRGFQLGDPAQSRGEELFKSSNLIHSTTDSEKLSQRHEIQTTTEDSCAQWPRRLTSKLTKKSVGGWGATNSDYKCRIDCGGSVTVTHQVSQRSKGNGL